MLIQNEILKYSTTNREGYREFKSNGEICERCPKLSECTNSANHVKISAKHIWSDYLELVEDYRHTPKYKELYARRKETIERVFADAKEKYAMRYTKYRGLTKVSSWVKRKFAAMNLKKFAIHRWEMAKKHPHDSIFLHIFYFHPNLKPCFRLKQGFSTV